MMTATASLVPYLPLLLTGMFALLAPSPLPTANRSAALRLIVTAMLLSGIVTYLLIRQMSGSDSMNASRWISMALTLLATGLAALPLLDRARSGSLLLASCSAGVLLVPLFLHALIPKLPALGGVTFLYAILIASLTIGLGGSWQVKRLAARYTATGARRMYPIASHPLFLGQWMAGGLLILLADLMTAPDIRLSLLPPIFAGLLAALIGLLMGGKQALPTAGSAWIAGVLLSVGAPLPLEAAFAAGAIAGMLSLYREAITQRLRLDDPHYLAATWLLPALLGMALPALRKFGAWDAAVAWYVAALGIGLVGAAVLWPVTKLTVGLALTHHAGDEPKNPKADK